MSQCASLRQLTLGAPPAAWAAAGFVVAGTRCRIGDVELLLTGGEAGLRGWTLGGSGSAEAIDGLPTTWTADTADAPGPPHPIGVVRLDHVVVVTDALERTTEALAAEAGLEVRRIREAGGGVRQAFLWLGDRQLLLEVVESPDAPAGGARLWGLTVVTEDLDAAGARLGPALGPSHAAVQPGRRIATVRREAGLGAAVALITPRHGGGNRRGS